MKNQKEMYRDLVLEYVLNLLFAVTGVSAGFAVHLGLEALAENSIGFSEHFSLISTGAGVVIGSALAFTLWATAQVLAKEVFPPLRSAVTEPLSRKSGSAL